jgi:alpha-ketoglutarate-dependent taurine dioxygenase
MPPEWVSLYMLQKPPNGGDTLFASTVGAYERLSPSQQKLVDSLEVVNRCRPRTESSISCSFFCKRNYLDSGNLAFHVIIDGCSDVI